MRDEGMEAVSTPTHLRHLGGSGRCVVSSMKDGVIVRSTCIYNTSRRNDGFCDPLCSFVPGLLSHVTGTVLSCTVHVLRPYDSITGQPRGHLSSGLGCSTCRGCHLRLVGTCTGTDHMMN